MILSGILKPNAIAKNSTTEPTEPTSLPDPEIKKEIPPTAELTVPENTVFSNASVVSDGSTGSRVDDEPASGGEKVNATLPSTTQDSVDAVSAEIGAETGSANVNVQASAVNEAISGDDSLNTTLPSSPATQGQADTIPAGIGTENEDAQANVVNDEKEIGISSTTSPTTTDDGFIGESPDPQPVQEAEINSTDPPIPVTTTDDGFVRLVTEFEPEETPVPELVKPTTEGKGIFENVIDTLIPPEEGNATLEETAAPIIAEEVTTAPEWPEKQSEEEEAEDPFNSFIGQDSTEDASVEPASETNEAPAIDFDASSPTSEPESEQPLSIESQDAEANPEKSNYMSIAEVKKSAGQTPTENKSSSRSQNPSQVTRRVSAAKDASVNTAPEPNALGDSASSPASTMFVLSIIACFVLT